MRTDKPAASGQACLRPFGAGLAGTAVDDVVVAASSMAQWQPVFNAPPQLAAVADDARGTHAQIEHFGRLAVTMRANVNEVSFIVEALQLCERVHGYCAIAASLAVVTAAIESAVVLMGLPVSSLAAQRGQAHVGLFVGEQVEACARINAELRCFPLSTAPRRMGSPHVEYMDCLIGAQVAASLGWIGEADSLSARPYAALATAFRRRGGRDGLAWLERIALETCEAQSPDPVAHFIRLVAGAAGDEIALPAQWRRYARQQSTEHRAQTVFIAASLPYEAQV